MPLRAFLILVAVGLCAAAPAAEPAPPVILGDLRIERPWLRATPPNALAAAGYLTITNAGTTGDRLVAAFSDRAARVELHDMKVVDGTMTMRPLGDGLAIPAGRSVTLQPGSVHLMLRRPGRGLEEGETVAIDLEFERAGAVTVTFPVLGIGAPGPEAAGSD